MTREIKFKFWDKDKKCMFSWDDVIYGLESDISAWFSYINRIPLQFTGLKDKNGVEIYEGDIVVPHFKKHGKGEHASVEWAGYNDGEYVSNVECWVADGAPISDNGGLWGAREHVWEVIGNVYQNKELLNEN